MKLSNSKRTVASGQKAGGRGRLPLRSLGQRIILLLFITAFVVSTVCFVKSWFSREHDERRLEEQQITLRKDMQSAIEVEEATPLDNTPEPEVDAFTEEVQLVMLPEYETLYKQNKDLVGWLRIEDTVIDYPIMQCLEDENYYLSRDFYGKENSNGCLILDNDSNAGVGIKEHEYAKGVAPSTNLIIHGHTMKSGQMFGNLKLYQDKEYGMSHKIICFDSLYEKREYELIAVFYSQVYYQSDDVFKYYHFFRADTQEEFDDWYNNITNMSLYDTGVIAEFGDEFITLSCCAYHVEDGRFVVVGKRKYN